MTPSFPSPRPAGEHLAQWWMEISDRLTVGDRAGAFFRQALGSGGILERLAVVGADIDYVLFVLLRYWVPTVLPPTGRERLTKNDVDYWLESEQILKAAVVRLRELKPLIELLTSQNPLGADQQGTTKGGAPAVEVELASMLEGIAEVAGGYGGPDYTSVIKNFDPIPLRQTQPFKHNKKHSAELWVVFLLREHFKTFGLGKDRYWPLVAAICTPAGILQPNGQPYTGDELKSWWQKHWPRTYTQLDQRQTVTPELSGEAYQKDFEWYRAWLTWQRRRRPISST